MGAGFANTILPLPSAVRTASELDLTDRCEYQAVVAEVDKEHEADEASVEGARQLGLPTAFVSSSQPGPDEFADDAYKEQPGGFESAHEGTPPRSSALYSSPSAGAYHMYTSQQALHRRNRDLCEMDAATSNPGSNPSVEAEVCREPANQPLLSAAGPDGTCPDAVISMTPGQLSYHHTASSPALADSTSSWQQAWDYNWSRWYYYNEALQVTQWEPPDEPFQLFAHPADGPGSKDSATVAPATDVDSSDATCSPVNPDILILTQSSAGSPGVQHASLGPHGVQAPDHTWMESQAGSPCARNGPSATDGVSWAAIERASFVAPATACLRNARSPSHASLLPDTTVIAPSSLQASAARQGAGRAARRSAARAERLAKGAEAAAMRDVAQHTFQGPTPGSHAHGLNVAAGAARKALPRRLSRFWFQRYSLWSRFDDGILMDEAGWFSVTPEVLAFHQACRCSSFMRRDHASVASATYGTDAMHQELHNQGQALPHVADQSLSPAAVPEACTLVNGSSSRSAACTTSSRLTDAAHVRIPGASGHSPEVAEIYSTCCNAVCNLADANGSAETERRTTGQTPSALNDDCCGVASSECSEMPREQLSSKETDAIPTGCLPAIAYISTCRSHLRHQRGWSSESAKARNRAEYSSAEASGNKLNAGATQQGHGSEAVPSASISDAVTLREGNRSTDGPRVGSAPSQQHVSGLFVDGFAGVGGNAVQAALAGFQVIPYVSDETLPMWYDVSQPEQQEQQGVQGIGMDTPSMSSGKIETWHRVLAVDTDATRLELVAHNARIYGIAHRIELLCADFFQVALQLKADVVFLSPPWGGLAYRDQSCFHVNEDFAGLGTNLAGMLDIAARALRNHHAGCQMHWHEIMGRDVEKKGNCVLAVFLPRHSSLEEVTEACGNFRPCMIERAFLNKQLKAITLYLNP